MIRTAVSVIMVLFLGCLSGFALDKEKEEEHGTHRFFNFSLYYPVSINQSPYDTVNVNLSLIYGRVGTVSGLDFSLAGSAVHNGFRGVQICGLAGVTGENGSGIQTSGLISVCGENFTGLQASGLITVAGETLRGFQAAGLISVAGREGRWLQASGLGSVAGEEFEGGQFSGLFSVTGENMKGIQAAGLFNVTGENMKGLQASGLFNVVGEEFIGGQVSGLFNVAGEELHGFQLAPLNVAVHSYGVQIGLVNTGDTCDGLQIGLVNYMDGEHNGVPVGAVNLAENGSLNGVFWASGNVPVSGGVKFYIGRWHSVVSLGAGNLDDNITESLTWGVHYGTAFPAGNLSFQPEIGYRYRDNSGFFKNSAQKPDQHILEARIMLKIPVYRNMSILAGGGWQRMYDAGPEDRNGRSSLLFAAGVELF